MHYTSPIINSTGSDELRKMVKQRKIPDHEDFGRIGAHAFCGMGSVINKDVPPYVMVNGQPVKPHGINSEGLKRRDFSDEQIITIKRAYKTLYTKGLRLSEAAEVLREMAANESALKPLLDFIDLSDRTIVR